MGKSVFCVQYTETCVQRTACCVPLTFFFVQMLNFIRTQNKNSCTFQGHICWNHYFKFHFLLNNNIEIKIIELKTEMEFRKKKLTVWTLEMWEKNWARDPNENSTFYKKWVIIFLCTINYTVFCRMYMGLCPMRMYVCMDLHQILRYFFIILRAWD